MQFFSWKSDCRDLFFWRYCETCSPQSSDEHHWHISDLKLFVCEHSKSYSPESSQAMLPLPEKKGNECHSGSFWPSISLWWHPLSNVSPSTNNVPFSFVIFCLIFRFIWRVIYYSQQKIIFITLKMSQPGPSSRPETDTVLHVQWHVPLIFQARSNSASVVCTCPALAPALIQMAPLYGPAVQEQLFSEAESVLFSRLCPNHLLQSFIIQLFLTSCPLLLFLYCSLFVSLTEHFVLLIHTVAPLP